MRTQVSTSRLLCFSCAVLVTLTSFATAQTTRPFTVRGNGIVEFVPSTPGESARHWSTGTMTYVGRHVAVGRVQLVDFLPPVEGQPPMASFKSKVPVVFYGRRRTLKYDYGRGPNGLGKVTLIPINPAAGVFATVWDAEFTLAEPSGRVSKSSFRMIATGPPFTLGSKVPVPFQWEGRGTITYGGRRRRR